MSTPVPPDADLRDFHFYPLEVRRLLDSALSATNAEVFRVAVLSWCVAWHQLPAGSLPNDDAALARLMGFGRDLRGWKKVRAAGGMRGWEAAEDGLLYHPVVTAKVIEALAGKRKQRNQTEAARLALLQKKKDQQHTLSQDSVTGSKLTVDSRQLREERGQGIGAVPVTDLPPAKETGGAQPHPDLRDKTTPFDEGPEEPLDDRSLIRPLAPWVRWRTNDPETTADNVAELAGLIRIHGAQVIMEAARKGHAGGEKLWPNEITTHLPSAGAVASKGNPRAARAAALVAKHGIEAIKALTKITFRDEAEAREALTINPKLADMVEKGAA